MNNRVKTVSPGDIISFTTRYGDALPRRPLFEVVKAHIDKDGYKVVIKRIGRRADGSPDEHIDWWCTVHCRRVTVRATGFHICRDEDGSIIRCSGPFEKKETSAFHMPHRNDPTLSIKEVVLHKDVG